MFNVLLLEYVLMKPDKVCDNDTECNITAVAISWRAGVWDWDKMPARISYTRQFEGDGVWLYTDLLNFQ